MERNKRIRKIVNSIKQPSKNCIWLKDGKLYYYGTTGWTLIQGQDKINIESIKEVIITENGEVTITPSAGYDATLAVTANIQVKGKPKTLDITKNGTYTVVGDDQPISQVTVNAKVTEVATTWTDVDGMKYSQSNITKFQDGYKFAPRTGINCVQMFYGCENLVEIPLFDTSNATDAASMFARTLKINTIPEFDMRNLIYASQMFDRSNIETAPQLNTISLQNADGMFQYCGNLKSVGKMDFSNVNSAILMFQVTNNIVNLGGFTGLKINFSISNLSKLTKESLLNVINEAADVTSTPKTLTLGATNLAKLTDEEKALATNKGWTLA